MRWTRRTSPLLLVLALACGGGEPPKPVAERTAADWAGFLRDGVAEERVEAATHLGWLGTGALPAREALAEALTDPLPQVRTLAAFALASLGQGAAPAVPACPAVRRRASSWGPERPRGPAARRRMGRRRLPFHPSPDPSYALAFSDLTVRWYGPRIPP